MLLHRRIKEQYSSKESQLSLILEMGYGNSKKGLVTLQEFMKEGSIEAWLKKGRYDFKYGNEDFVKSLAKVLEVNVAPLLIEAHRRIGKEREYANTSLHPIVHFERKGESILTLMANNKYLEVPYEVKELIYKSDEEVFEQMRIYAKNHYKKYQGVLPIWGKIEGYKYYYIDGLEYRIDISEM